MVNISEGRSTEVLTELASACGRHLLDVHTDPHHNRSVFTLAGEGVERTVRDLATAAIGRLDIREHDGVHPRIGVVDVVPFIALEGSSDEEAQGARDDFARWFGWEVGVPTFIYGPERSLPEVRRKAFTDLVPDNGPVKPHVSAGATAVGVRPLLVAFNLWVDTDVATAKDVARSVRSPVLRTLGLQVGDRVQVSCNLIDPSTYGPAAAVDAVQGHVRVVGTELVGLVPRSVLTAQPPERWAELDLSEGKTIEARLEENGLR